MFLLGKKYTDKSFKIANITNYKTHALVIFYKYVCKLTVTIEIFKECKNTKNKLCTMRNPTA